MKKNILIITLAFISIFSNILYAQQPVGNTGLYFDGVDDRVNIPSSASLSFAGNQIYTIMMWVKIPQYRSADLMRLPSGAVGTQGICFSIEPTGQITFANDNFSGGGWHTLRTTNPEITPNQWTHLAFFSDGTGIKKIFVNGNEKTTVSTGTNAYLTATSSGQGWSLGLMGFLGAYFKGQIDEVRIFNSDRSLSIGADMNSTNPDGALGYWNLDQTTGTLTNAGTLGAAVNLTLPAPPTDPLRALRVTNNGDAFTPSVGMLRWAINQVNANTTNNNYIDFSIQQTDATITGKRTIVFATAMPDITKSVFIDGYSAYGAAPNTNAFGMPNNAQIRIELNCVGLGSPSYNSPPGVPSDPLHSGLLLNGVNNSIIRGLSIYGVPGGWGSQFAIDIQGGTNNRIEGCYIGFQANGTPAGASNMNGIAMGSSGAPHILGWSGTLDVGKFNVISNTDFSGVTMGGNTIVQGNYIGVNPSGTFSNAVTNASRGIVTMGTGGQILNNVISNNGYLGNGDQGGIYLQSGANGTIIKGNRIGTTIDGLGSAPNAGNGITVYGGGSSAVSNIVIGGTGAGEANIIANNIGVGVQVDGSVPGATGNKISGNHIYGNTDLGGGIDLINAGNANKPLPTLSIPTLSRATGTCQNNDIIELFDDSPASVGNQGRKFLGFVSAVGTNWTFTTIGFPPNTRITATATSHPAEPNPNSTSPFTNAIMSPPLMNINTLNPVRNALNIAKNGDIVTTFSANIPAPNNNTIKVMGSQTGFYTAGIFGGAGTPNITWQNPVFYDFKAGETVTVEFLTTLIGGGGEQFMSTYQYQFTVQAAGTGNFIPTHYPSSQINRRFAMADMDQDGDVDMVMTNPNPANTASVWLNNGKGHYTLWGSYSLGTLVEPNGICLGDWDQDGDIDAVVTGYTNGMLAIMKNNGNGVLNTTSNLQVTSTTSLNDCRTADMDGDGDMDLVVAVSSSCVPSCDSKIAIYKNNGTGIFTFSGNNLVQSAVGAYNANVVKPFIADLDNDGDMDVVATNYHQSPATFSVFKNNGNATFITSVEYNVPTSGAAGNVWGVDGRDLDNDGFIDLVFSLLSGGAGTKDIRIFRNTGTGAFVYQTGDFSLPTIEPYDVKIGDMDGDNDPDIVATGRDADLLYYYRNDGAWVFTRIDIPCPNRPIYLELADVDADNDLDVVVIKETTNGFSVYRNALPYNITNLNPVRNALNFSTAGNIVTTFDENMNTPFATVEFKVMGSQTGFYTAGSFTGNLTNTVTFNPDQNFKAGETITVEYLMSLLSNNGKSFLTAQQYQFRTQSKGFGNFVSVNTYNTGSAPMQVAAGDIDGDGLIDVVVSNQNTNSVSVFQNTGNGNLTFVANHNVAAFPRGIILADLDNDGDLDIGTANNNGDPAQQVSILRNNGGWNFAAAQQYSAGGGLSDTASDPIYAADMDGNGYLDIVVQNNSSIRILRNNADGNFSLATNLTAINNDGRGIHLADLDNDGDMDIAVANGSANNISIYKNNGNFVFAPRADYPSAGGSSVHSIISADFTADGFLDLAVCNLTPTNSVSVFTNSGTGTFGTRNDYTGGGLLNNPASLFASDFDGDNDLDISVTNNAGNTVSILKNNGAGDFSAPIIQIPTGTAATAITHADLDNDQDMDMIVINGASNKISVLLNESPFIVMNTNDSGAGSLRQAIISANANPDFNTIIFNIAGGGVKTINLNSSLGIINPVFISGYSQAGASGNTLPMITSGSNAQIMIELNFSAVGSGNDGLVINNANNSIIEGLAIKNVPNSGGANAGIRITGTSSGNQIRGCFIGINADGISGTFASSGNMNGVLLEATGFNTVGGTNMADRNVIAANDYNGILVGGATSVQIENNMIGLNKNKSANGNTDGILLASNTVLNPVLVKNNLIGHNQNNGIRINNSRKSRIESNLIGTDGSVAMPNAFNGIRVEATSQFITIGGLNPTEGNVISGNTQNGILIDNSINNTIYGNTIGTKIDFSTALPNAQNGILIQNNSHQNQIGFTTASGGNVISGNTQNGILLNLNSHSNIIRGNFIGTNQAGTAAISNNHGVFLSNNVDFTTIGGIGFGNIISGNGGSGININNSAGADYTSIKGNLIGTNLTGNSAIPNANLCCGNAGINIWGAATYTQIGGALAGEGNLVSGNNSYGYVQDNSKWTEIRGNKFGTNYTGMNALPNLDGITILAASTDFVTIGGANLAEGNLISGNRRTGVHITGQNAVLSGNIIGLNQSQTAALSNGTTSNIRNSGIYIAGSNNTIGFFTGNVIAGNTANNSRGIFISANNVTVQNNSIGVNSSGLPFGNTVGVFISVGAFVTVQNNTIAHNTNEGIRLETALSQNNKLSQNRIFCNGITSKSINLNGVANSNKQPPVILNATPTQVSGTSVANDFVEVFFHTGSCFTTVQASTFLTVVQADGLGNWSFTTAAGLLNIGDQITSTATDLTNNTSEFSPFATIGDPFVVVNTNDSGTGSLRQTIINANANPDFTTITFNIPTSDPNYVGGSYWRITPNTVLPMLSQPVLIDGYSQTGAVPNSNPVGQAWNGTLKIQLAGNLMGVNSILRLAANNIEIRGLNLAFSTTSAVFISASAQFVTISGCLIGTNIAGTGAQANLVGIEVIGNNKLIGGTANADRNVISGNTQANIYLNNAGISQIKGNYIGTNASGNLGIYTTYGIAFNNVSNSIIGGTTQAEGNVISGNGQGIFMQNSPNNQIKGNKIGTSINGLNAIANTSAGIKLMAGGSSSNLIGGNLVGEGNLIAGNSNFGVWLSGNSQFNTVAGNFIGLRTDFSTALSNGTGILIDASANNNLIGFLSANVIAGNSADAIAISSAGTGNVIKGNLIGLASIGNTQNGIYINNTSSTIIGGILPNEPNIISYNSQNGIFLNDAGSTNSQISTNRIFCNGLKSINLNGVANSNKPVPVIVAANTTGAAGTAEPNDQVEIFLHTGACGTTTAQAFQFITSVQANLVGYWNFTTVEGSLPFTLGNHIVATATGNLNNNTSELSNFATVVSPLVVVHTLNSGAGSLREAINYANLNPDFSTISFAIPTIDPNYNPNFGGFWRITPSGIPLPSITQPTMLDGYSQAGAVPNSNPINQDWNGTIKIQLSGQNFNSGGTLTVGGNNVVIKGLSFISTSQVANILVLTTAQFTTVSGCLFGTDITGTVAHIGNNGIGIAILGQSNWVGGDTNADRNVIAASTSAGVYIANHHNRVINNFIGTSKTGQNNLPNYVGISVSNANYAKIKNNLISGNETGIALQNAVSTHITQNRIGVGRTGLAAVSNTIQGILIDSGSSFTTIGGLGEGNVISGNVNNQIVMNGTNNTISYNYIGTNINGENLIFTTSALFRGIYNTGTNNTISQNVISGNTRSGIRSDGGVLNILNNKIGVSNTNLPLGNGVHGIYMFDANGVISQNQIAFNAIAGAFISSINPHNVRISQNSIYNNGLIGIDLVGNALQGGVTPNDPQDLDSGTPNNMQNYPEFATGAVAAVLNGNLVISYYVPTSTSATQYPMTVEFYLSDGGRQGKTFLTALTYTFAQAEQFVTVSITPFTSVPLGSSLVATATDGLGNTSEFSTALLVDNACPSSPFIADFKLNYTRSCATAQTFAVLTIANGRSGFYQIDWQNDGIYDALNVPLSTLNQLTVELPNGTILNNPKVINYAQPLCPSASFTTSGIIQTQPSAPHSIAFVSVIEPTNCDSSNGQILVKLDGNIPSNASFDIDLDGDNQYEFLSVLPTPNQELSFKNLKAGFRIGVIKVRQSIINNCVASSQNLNRTLAFASIVSNTNLSVIPEKETLDFNTETNIIIENAQIGASYRLAVGTDFRTANASFVSEFITAKESTVKIPTGKLIDNTSFYVVVRSLEGCENTLKQTAFISVRNGIYQEQLEILQAVFSQTGGLTWKNPWTFSPTLNLQGVVFDRGNIISLDLSYRGVKDILPTSILKLPKLQLLNVEGNELTFKSLLPFSKTAGFVFKYKNQEKINSDLSFTTVEGATIKMHVEIEGTDLQFQWYKDGKALEGEIFATLTLTTVSPSQSGIYHATIMYKDLPELLILRNNIKLTVTAQPKTTDLAQLADFYNKLGGKNWINQWNLSDPNLANWFGLIVQNGKIISVSLVNNHLQGELPADIFGTAGFFANVENLNLSGNQLGGKLPESLKTMKNLKRLDISGNRFSNDIWAIITEIPDLEVLILTDMGLLEIPENISNLKKLKVLMLDQNQLKALPLAVGKLENLQILNLAYNELEELPDVFSNLKFLERFYFHRNQIKNVPRKLGLTSLIELTMSRNQISLLPEDLRENKNLEFLDLTDNLLNFSELEKILAKSGGRTEGELRILYAPQGRFGQSQEKTLGQGSSLVIPAQTSGNGNTYTWLKDGQTVRRLNAPSNGNYVITNVSKTDAGVYSVMVTNPIAPDLTLYSYETKIVVTCATQTSASLQLTGNPEFCEGEQVDRILTINDLPANNTVQWFKDDLRLVGATNGRLSSREKGVYKALITDPEGCSNFVKGEIRLEHLPTPKPEILTDENEATILKVKNTEEYITFQWYKDEIAIPSAISSTHKADAVGDYRVRVTNRKGCEGISSTYKITPLANEQDFDNQELRVYPNPASEVLQIEVPPALSRNYRVSLWNMQGKEVFESQNVKILNISHLPVGLYMVRIRFEGKEIWRKVQVEK